MNNAGGELSIETSGSNFIKLNNSCESQGNNIFSFLVAIPCVVLATIMTNPVENYGYHNITSTNMSNLPYEAHQEEIAQKNLIPTQIYQRKLFGMLKGKVIVSKEFFDPLPDEVIFSFYGK